jgi:hypothetical protein
MIRDPSPAIAEADAIGPFLPTDGIHNLRDYGGYAVPGGGRVPGAGRTPGGSHMVGMFATPLPLLP